MSVYKTKEQRMQLVRDILAGVAPQAKYREDWFKAVRTFKDNAQDPAFAETLVHDRARLELFINKLVERKKSTHPDESIAHFLSHHHVFNRYSLAGKEEVVLQWIGNLTTSEQRARVLGSNAWLRNIMRDANKKSEYGSTVVDLLDGLHIRDLKTAVLNTNNYLRFTIESYIPHDKARELLNKVMPKV